ncbi:hypothetical protein G7072_03195 [Nocardioides sp. HDW12B]|uniref:hypothetical protein n=1 Tax=Nocardioides sp. HDW12B TaxID=2714939 RepID=UPI00140BCC9A|nr:hypothetical protein [Nocardioides sp. HDW12B]QIK65475.1 hypothetical protein G7072_03195 [Nocardioides sp. HDW12B]
MPDTFDDHFADLRAVPPAPGSPADARRRGDHLRRRRTATVAAGSALAVALTVGGVAWSQAGTQSRSQDPVAPSPSVVEPSPSEPAPTPSESAPAPSETPDADLTPEPGGPAQTAIAPDFPLLDGWPEPDPEDVAVRGPSPDLRVFDERMVCGQTVDLLPSGGVEQLGARQMGITRGGDRLLVTFPDAAAAGAALERVVTALDRCPRDPSSPDDEEVLVSVVEPVDLGDEAQRVTLGSEYGDTPGLYLTVYHLVRQGNALLLDEIGSEGGGSKQGVTREQRDARDAVTGVVEAMCVYRDGGC